MLLKWSVSKSGRCAAGEHLLVQSPPSRPNDGPISSLFEVLAPVRDTNLQARCTSRHNGDPEVDHLLQLLRIAVGPSTASLRGSATPASERTGETSARGLSSSQNCA